MNKEQLTQKLDELEVFLSDIYEDISQLQELLDVNGFVLSLEYVAGEADSFIFANYFSDKLSKSIILSWDIPTAYATTTELAEALLAYESEARAIEAKIKD